MVSPADLPPAVSSPSRAKPHPESTWLSTQTQSTTITPCVAGHRVGVVWMMRSLCDARRLLLLAEISDARGRKCADRFLTHTRALSPILVEATVDPGASPHDGPELANAWTEDRHGVWPKAASAMAKRAGVHSALQGLLQVYGLGGLGKGSALVLARAEFSARTWREIARCLREDPKRAFCATVELPVLLHPFTFPIINSDPQAQREIEMYPAGALVDEENVLATPMIKPYT